MDRPNFWEYQHSQVMDYGLEGGADQMGFKTDNLLDVEVTELFNRNESNDFTNLGEVDLGDLSQLSDLNAFNLSGAESEGGLSNFGVARHGLLNDGNLEGQVGLQLNADGYVPIYQVSNPIPGTSSAAGKSKMLQERRPAVSMDSVMFPDKENIVAEDWAGPYNFMVTPDAASKKAIFDSDLNKLFSNIHVSVPFRFEMAFEKIPDLKDFAIRASLVYLDDDLKTKPVMRCYKHVGEEQNLTEEDQKVRIQHILRPSIHGEARYVQNETTKRCYLSLPVKYPEPGVTYTVQCFNFACLNSCATIPSGTSSTKRDLGLLFVLYGQIGGEFKAVGRRFIKLRVCSAPARDHLKEQQGGRRKRARLEQDQLQVEPKRANVNQEQDQQEVVPPIVQAHSSVRVVLTGPIPAIANADETVSSSQESIYSSCDTDSRIPFRKLVQDIQWTLRQKNSSNPMLRDFSSHVFRCLRMVQGLCQSARKCELDTVEEENEKSPDAGFDENHGQD